MKWNDAMQKMGYWLPKEMIGVFLFFGTMPFWIEAVGLYQYLGLEIVILIIYALGYNILLGYTGLPSFGHGALFGVGGYAIGISQFELFPNLWLGLLSAILVGALFGGIMGLFMSHRRGIYFALLSIALSQIIMFAGMQASDLTGGEDGLLGIDRLPVDFGFFLIDISTTERFYYFVFAVFVIITLLLYRLIHSPLGKILMSIKQNEQRAQFLGYNVRFYKWLSIVLSSAVAGLAGGLMAMAQEAAFINVMSLQWSGTVVFIVLIGGGLVSFWGPVVGTVIYIGARDLLGLHTEAWMLWYGLLFMLIVMFKPEGIMGNYHDIAAGRSVFSFSSFRRNASSQSGE